MGIKGFIQDKITWPLVKAALKRKLEDKKMRAWLSGYKAYIAGAGVILTAVAAYANNTMDLSEMITAIFTGLGIMGLRAGIAKINNGK